MTQALAGFLGHVDTRPLYAQVASHNAASIRVLENCGFRTAGEEPEGLILELVGEKDGCALHGNVSERSTGVKIESEGVFVGPDEGKVIQNPIGGRMVVKVRDRDTGGSYSVHDNVIPAGSPGPLPHLHCDHEEIFYVLEGELTVRVGERKRRPRLVRSS
jgi:mannose-6-phosphate isomerase-like protein (cupin superfamily)